MNEIETTTNMLYFYHLSKDIFSRLDFSKSPLLISLLNRVIPNNNVIIIHNSHQKLTIYNEDLATDKELADLVEALPLLFQGYSLTKIAQHDIDQLSLKLSFPPSTYKDGYCFALELNKNESLWFVFMNSDSAYSELQTSIISDIYLFLKDIINFSTNVAHGALLNENLRDEKNKQGIWLESLAWLNDLGSEEYSDDEMNELYKSALFQLKNLVRADHAAAFHIQEDGSFRQLISHSDQDISRELIEILTDASVLKNLQQQKHFSLDAHDYKKLKELNMSTLNIYPLFLQKKLKLVLLVSRTSTYFDVNEDMIATLFSEGLEHIIVRMYFLRTMRQQNADMKKEQLEQEILISKLRDAQDKLLQNEKMASIGQLAAGVAHEINNPVGYVNSNINSLESYITDIYRILDVYQELEKNIAEDNPQREQLKELKADIDFNFIRDDIKELLNESKEGTLRVKQIVKDLKDFSHVEEAEWQLTDLEKGIESTLNIVQNELKYKAKIYKDYGNIPKIECVPSQINQIMMNLLVNAGHAIDEQGKITIKTRVLNEKYIYAEIIDTGKGIPPENLTKIFDPFFTTKPIGQGTGLGLSLSYSIAEKHGGELSVKSVLGECTTFRLMLPIKKIDIKSECTHN